MEEEDAILGLPHTAPEVGMSLPADTTDGAEAPGWNFERALQAANHHGNAAGASDKDSDDDEGSESEDENNSEAEGEAYADANGASSGHAGATEGGAMDDAALERVESKKEAKKLGKKLYKRWKKLHKKSKKSKSSKKDRKSKSKKDKKDNKSSSKDKKGHSSSRKRRSRAEDNEDDYDDNDMLLRMGGDVDDGDAIGLVPAVDLAAAAAEVEARHRKAALREAKLRTEKATKKLAQQKTTSAEVIAIARELVAAMAKARQMDEDIVRGRDKRPGSFPLNRVALKDLVQARCRQAYMVGPLVEAGILQELSYWLYDVDHAEPAPYELRTTALDILVSFPMERHDVETEDLTQFLGIGREHLIKTDIGRVLNALRRYNDETIDNRGKCVQLLTAFSRVISGTSDKDQSDETKSKAVWKCQRDPTVASPFEVLETSSEALQKTFMKPDPRDPTSYNGLLPWRPPAATITNVSGKLKDYIEKAPVPKR